VVIDNEKMRDYEIGFLLDSEFQKWIGRLQTLMYEHPYCKVLYKKKLKK